MVLFNYAIREITAKIVYYGPGLCGKTTNLQFIHGKLDPGARGKLLSLATDGDRTLFFDFLPIEMGAIGGFKVRVQLYTVPGQVHYNATRRLVLKGVDAVAFVADSQVSMIERNRESYENLVENLIENGYDPARVPVVVQLNKRDLPGVASVGELVAAIGVDGLPVVEAVANRGDGVFETLKAVVKITLTRLRSQFEAETPAERREAPPPPPVFPSAPEVPAADAAEDVDEFDLAAFADGPAPPAGLAAAPGGAEGAVAPTEPAEPAGEAEGGLEALTEADLGPEEAEAVFAGEERNQPAGEAEPAAGDAAPDTDDQWRQGPAPAEYAAAGPAVDEGAPPYWGRELLEELREARAENRELREAFQVFLGLLDRQIDALQQARELLARRLGGGEGGGGP